jgi:hypothetical protein
MVFYEKDAKTLSEQDLNFNYPTTTLFYTDCKTESDDGNANYYYKIKYPDQDPEKSSLNSSLFFGGNNYKPTSMYIYSLLHNNIDKINDKEIIGELVIEHSNDSNNDKVYLCILLKKPEDGAIDTDINDIPISDSVDIIINMADGSNTTTPDGGLSMISPNDNSTKTIDLEKTILNESDENKPNARCYIYKDIDNADNTVVILTKPIVLKNPGSVLRLRSVTNKTTLFNISQKKSNYLSNRGNTGNTSNQVPATSDDYLYGKKLTAGQIYIDCQPTGPSLKEIATYDIPFGSALSQDIQKMDFMKTSVNFFVFCIGLVFIYFTVPMFYKMLVIDKIIVYIKKDDEFLRKQTIRSADILICTSIIIYVLFSFYYGFKGDGDVTLITSGLFAIVFLGISTSLILIKKLDSDFLTYKSDTINLESKTTESFTNITNVLGLLSSTAAFMLSTKGALLHILAVNLIFFITMIILRFATKIIPDNKTLADITIPFVFIYIPLSVATFIFLSQT